MERASIGLNMEAGTLVHTVIMLIAEYKLDRLKAHEQDLGQYLGWTPPPFQNITGLGL